jgi:hypothetical protein
MRRSVKSIVNSWEGGEAKKRKDGERNEQMRKTSRGTHTTASASMTNLDGKRWRVSFPLLFE